MSDTVIIDQQDGVCHITLNRPEKKNAFSTEQWHAFTEALLAAQENDKVRVVLLSGAGGNFSSGQDLSAFMDAAEGEEHPFDRCARTVCEFDKPLIAAVSGIAVGGGATLAFHADILYVGDSLRMRLPFVSLGLVPEFASSYVLQASIGSRRAAELFYTAEWIDADRAVDTGIATAKVTDAELLDHARAKALQIAQWPVNSLRETKRCLKHAHSAQLSDMLTVESEAMMRQAGSAENIEAITAFMEKRPPNFDAS